MAEVILIRIETQNIIDQLQELAALDRRSRTQEVLWLIEQEIYRRKGLKPAPEEQQVEDCIEA